MRRALGSFETALTLTCDHSPFVVVLVLQLEDGPSPERLRRALDSLQARHPPLAARIVERSGRFAYEPGAPAISLEARPRRADGDWRAVAEEELGRSLDRATGPLLRCLHLDAASGAGVGPARSEIVLTFHHAIVDGASATSLVAELLRLCAGDGEEAGTAAATPALPAVESLFPRRFRGARATLRLGGFVARQLADELAFRLRSRGRPEPAIEPPARCRIRSLDLSVDETAALVRRSRRERATLTAALHAALLLAVHRHLHDGRSGPLRYLAFADLRPHLDPPLEASALGSCIAMLRYTVQVDARASRNAFWPLAREVGRQVDAGVKRGDRYAAVVFSAPMMRRVLAGRMGRMAATAVSYPGPVRLRPEPEEGAPFRVRGLRSFVSNVAEGPEYTAQARLFEGELQLDVVYLEADMDERMADRMAEDVLGSLRAAGREAAP